MGTRLRTSSREHVSRRISTSALALLLACGCTTPGADDAGVDAAATDAGFDAGVCIPDELACVDPTPNPSCAATWVLGLRGEITALDGTAIEGGRPQLCARVAPDDRLVCLSPPESRADGTFTIEVPEEIRCLHHGAVRVLAPGQPYGSIYCPVALDGGGIVTVDEALRLPPVATASVPPRGDETVARDVTLPGGVSLGVAPDQLFSSTYEELAGGRVAPADVPCAPMTFDGAYAFYPESRVDGGATIRWTNDDGLAPGTVLDLYFVGGLDARQLDGTPVEEAEWVTFGTGTVSADGAHIESDAGSELPFLSWLAWKVR